MDSCRSSPRWRAAPRARRPGCTWPPRAPPPTWRWTPRRWCPRAGPGHGDDVGTGQRGQHYTTFRYLSRFSNTCFCSTIFDIVKKFSFSRSLLFKATFSTLTFWLLDDNDYVIVVWENVNRMQKCNIFVKFSFVLHNWYYFLLIQIGFKKHFN